MPAQFSQLMGTPIPYATPIATKILPKLPPILLLPPCRAGCPRADRLPAAETPTQWQAAVGRDCGNGGVFPRGFRLPRLLAQDNEECNQPISPTVGIPQRKRHIHARGSAFVKPNSVILVKCIAYPNFMTVYTYAENASARSYDFYCVWTD